MSKDLHEGNHIIPQEQPQNFHSIQQDHQSDSVSINSHVLQPVASHLTHVPSQISPGPDLIQTTTSNIQIPDEVYDRLSRNRKLVVVALVSYLSLLAPISSTTVLAAIPQVAADYNSTGTIISLSNALYITGMGFSPCFWGPLGQVYGRRWVCLVTGALFTACSLGTALAPNLAAFFVFRIFTAFEGTAFLIMGSACIGDIYRPQERATALGWFLSGTLIGPAFGPVIGGLIVTFTSWRVIFYLQTGLGGVGFLGAFFLLPETIHHKKADDLVGLPRKKKIRLLMSMISPLRVLRLFRYPNLLLVGLATGALVWNMYSLLTPIQYVLNPRFNLSSPIEGSLFFMAPGFGYLFGTLVGGRYADYVTVKWTKKRGERVSEDRLRSAVPFMGVVLPACMIIYGWSVEKAVGGVALPVIIMFLQGVAQLFCFPSLNTYSLDVMQSRSSEAVSSSYVIRYIFGTVGTAVVLPAIHKIGVGWFSSISALWLSICTLGIVANIKWGRKWREDIDAKKRAARKARQQKDSIVEVEKGCSVLSTKR